MRRYTVSIGDRAFTIDVQETAADRFRVSVDGMTFEATLRGDEDLPGGAISPEIPTTEIHPATGHVTPVAVLPPADRRTVPPGGRSRRAQHDVLTAPIPGVVLEVFVAPGDSLRRGDPILVLEAMKMRNTIRAPRDAIVLEVPVEAGQPVGPGDLLVRLGEAPG
jgi:biotin carboxyl carrier protein